MFRNYPLKEHPRFTYPFGGEIKKYLDTIDAPFIHYLVMVACLTLNLLHERLQKTQSRQLSRVLLMEFSVFLTGTLM